MDRKLGKRSNFLKFFCFPVFCPRIELERIFDEYENNEPSFRSVCVTDTTYVMT